MAWRAFNWGSRGLHYEVLPGVYVAALYIPKCIQGTLFCENTDTGQQLLNVFDFEAAAVPVTAGDCQAIDNLLVGWWASTMRAMCATNVRAIRAVAVGRDQFEGATWEVAMSTDGTRIGTPNPTEVTLSVKLAGNNIGRSRRGRKYAFPAVGTDLQSGTTDRFNNVYINALVAAYEQLRASSVSLGIPMRVASDTRQLMYPISHVLVVDDLLDSQRRRSAGRGR